MKQNMRTFYIGVLQEGDYPYSVEGKLNVHVMYILRKSDAFLL